MANAARGALGISSETCAEYGIEWRTAISIPPAETFSAVENSRNSLSASWARLLTKTGMARGRRGHRRRSPPGVLPFTDPSFLNPHLSFRITQHFKHLRGQKTQFPGKHTRDRGETPIRNYQLWELGVIKPLKPWLSPARAKGRSSVGRVLWALFRHSEECKLLPHLGNQLAFFVDKEK